MGSLEGSRAEAAPGLAPPGKRRVGGLGAFVRALTIERWRVGGRPSLGLERGGGACEVAVAVRARAAGVLVELTFLDLEKTPCLPQS